ncbi:hypothetical protein [Thiomonas sp. FB-Cd]|uniref:hypothetical protein n=1 Tax=Thiomonas sp. FB-Cd TaxID=1158292 RepID=UPI0004DFC11D|nr:hypothetical protein [Thiomonas sp. FB-Cd]
MKKNSTEETAVLTGNVAETDEIALKPAQQRIDPQPQPSAQESDLIDTQDSSPDGTATRKLSRYRRSVKLLQENWENHNTIRSTTRATNIEAFNTIRRRAIKDIGRGDPEVETTITMPQIIDHFLSRVMAGDYSRAGYTRYRTSILSEMSIQLKALGDASEMSEYVDAIDKLSQRVNSPKALFTANQLLGDSNAKRKSSEKKIGRADLKTILRELEERGEKGNGTLLWVQATMATGLRPVEWNQSELDGEGKLHTRRAKTHRHIAAFERMAMAKRIVGHDVKNVYEADDIIIKAMGEMPIAHIIEHRTLELEGDELDIVKRHLANVEREDAKGEDGFDKYQQACTKYLHRVCKSIWKDEKLYSLYSFRHQFAANAKRVMSLDEVKLSLGSNSAKKYARRSQSWRGLEGAGNYHRHLDTQAQQDAVETGAEPTPKPE